MALGGKTFRSAKQQKAFDASIQGRYMLGLKKNPFLFFGLPFLSAMVLGSFWLSSFTAIRYERHDNRQHEMDEEEIMKMHNSKRKFDLKEEYYRLQGLGEEDWEPKRVERFKGESENVW